MRRFGSLAKRETHIPGIAMISTTSIQASGIMKYGCPFQRFGEGLLLGLRVGYDPMGQKRKRD